MFPWLWIGVAGVTIAVAATSGFVWWARRRHARSLSHARESFRLRREWLEAEFVTRATASGKPRGLRWVDCDFDDDVAFARDRRTGRYRALVGVTIRFEAIEGGDMEEVEAVGNLKAATVNADVAVIENPQTSVGAGAAIDVNAVIRIVANPQI